jgi:Phosphotransferase enzyme family
MWLFKHSFLFGSILGDLLNCVCLLTSRKAGKSGNKVERSINKPTYRSVELVMSTHKNEDCQEEQDEDMEQFAPVVARLQLDKLPLVASSVRNPHRKSKNGLAASSLDCELVPKPLSGGYHILYIVKFTDGIRWIFKIPATGHPGKHDDMSAEDLRSEALTMQLLKRTTTIPLPEVYCFDTSLENEIKCPFILMEHIEAKSLRDVWFDQTVPREVLEERRIRSIRGVASAMVQLSRFQFDQAGQIAFDADDQLSQTVGPIRFQDYPAMLQHMNDGNESTVSFVAGPFTTAKSLLRAPFDRFSDLSPDKFGRGANKLLGLFIDWIPEPPEGPGCVLDHPDLDMQNVIVSENGDLRALIDWDGVCSIPRALGPESYPKWLTRDWDPLTYGYFTHGGTVENSPEELANYRLEYLRMIKGLKSTKNAAEPLEADVTLTRQSLVVDNIRIAASTFGFTLNIVEKVFKEITRLMSPETFQEMEEADKQTTLPLTEKEKASDCSPHEAIERDGEGGSLGDTRLQEPHLIGGKRSGNECDADVQQRFEELKIEDEAYEPSHSKKAGKPAQGAETACTAIGLDGTHDRMKKEEIEGKVSTEEEELKDMVEDERSNVPASHLQHEEHADREDEDGGRRSRNSDSDKSIEWKDDMGGFRFWDIVHALADGDLDDHRKAMLKEGFERLLAGE